MLKEQKWEIDFIPAFKLGRCRKALVLICQHWPQPLFSFSSSLFFSLLLLPFPPPPPPNTHTHTHTFADYVTDQDIEVVSRDLGTSWVELGQTLGFSGPELESFSLRVKAVQSKAGERMLREWQTLHRHNATFFALLGALEIIQRRDIADSLVAARMAGEGIAVWFMQFRE